MTSLAAGLASFQFTDMAQGRARAFVRARRHSARVRWLRRGLYLACVSCTAGLVLGAIFDPFRVLPAGLSMGDINLNGSRITMDLPKLTGYRNDGRPYSVTATTATQDIRVPGIVDLTDLRADVGMSDKSRAKVEAQSGHYDSGKELLSLSTAVKLTSDNGYNVRLDHVDIDFHAGTMVSDRPVSVVMSNGSIDADSMLISENGKRLAFTGKVRSILQPDPEAVAANRQLKGSQP